MPRDSVDWINLVFGALCTSLAAIGVAFVLSQEWAWLRPWLTVASAFFFVLGVVFFALAVYRIPLIPIILEKCRQKGKLWRREWIRRQERKKWHTAKRLEIILKEGHAALTGMHSLDPGSPPWPTLTALTGTARIEVANHYRQSANLQRTWIGVFDVATALEITPVEVRRLDVDGLPEIQSAGCQVCGVQTSARFARWIKPGEVEVFLIIETEQGRQRVKIDDVSFP